MIDYIKELNHQCGRIALEKQVVIHVQEAPLVVGTLRNKAIKLLQDPKSDIIDLQEAIIYISREIISINESNSNSGR